MARFKNTSLTPVPLSSGRTLSPGEDAVIEPDDNGKYDAEDQRSIDGGRLTELAPQPELEDLDREGLNTVAAGLGIETPEKLPNKDAVIAAIRDAEEA